MSRSPAVPPRLSIVVVPFGGSVLLAQCLEGLGNPSDSEILVPHDGSLPDLAELSERFPDVDFFDAGTGRSWPELRAAGVERGRGSLLALLEAQIRPLAGWAAAVCSAHEAPVAAVGGPVDKRRGGVLSWALYLLDYGRYAPPLTRGPARELTDCNVAYKRIDLLAVDSAWRGEFHENRVHDALRTAGRELRHEPRMLVEHLREIGLVEALRDRYRFGRLFGGTRAEGARLGRRLVLVAAAPLLPAVLTARAARHASTRSSLLGRLPAALPVMLLLALFWSLGELVGTLGGPGRSPAGSPKMAQ